MNTSTLSTKSSNIWQHPYVDIFKHVDLPNWVKAKKSGDVFSLFYYIFIGY